MQLILASQSPRRKELLGYFNYPFTVRPSNYDEDSHPWNGIPEEYVCELAEAKANVIPLQEDALILSADTVVYHEGRLFGKAPTLNEAKQFISTLQGKWHSVFTGVTVRSSHKMVSACEETRVRFHPLTEAEIDTYLQSIQWKDKAGAYAIQNAGGVIVKEIEGCYYNVIGLPLALTRELFMKHGIDLWHYLKKENRE